MRRTMMTMVTILAAALLAQACGSGLSHTVPEGDLTALTPEQRAAVDAANEEVVKARALIKEIDAQIAEGDTRVERAEKRVESAESAVEKAQEKIDDANAKLAAKKSSAAGVREAAIATAKAEYEHQKTSGGSADASVRDASIGVAKANYSKNVAVAEQAHKELQAANKAEKAEADKALKLERARLAYEEAKLTESTARKRALEADVWSKQANLELVKLDAVGAAKGTTDTPDFKERRIEFKEQLADREAAEREEMREVLELERETAKAKAKFDKLAPPPPPSDAPAPAAAEG